MRKQHKYKFAVIEKAPLIIYRHPDPDEKCTIGVDSSAGVGLDYTVFNVLSNRIPFEQLAVWRSKIIKPAEAAEELVALGWYYNEALLIIETNTIGAAVQDAVLTSHKYGRCFRRDERLDVDPSISDKFGWPTTQTSKWLLIRETQQALKDNEIILHDRTTIEELCNYVYIEDKSKTGAAEGLHDDCVISLMLAFHGAKLWPQKPKPKTTIRQKLSADAAQQRAMMKKFMERIQTRLAGKEKPTIM